MSVTKSWYTTAYDSIYKTDGVYHKNWNLDLPDSDGDGWKNAYEYFKTGEFS